jgi:hypothetical protein
MTCVEHFVFNYYHVITECVIPAVVLQLYMHAPAGAAIVSGECTHHLYAAVWLAGGTLARVKLSRDSVR